MKTMLVPILAIAAALSSALPALALEQKDSAGFDYKYEMSVLPTEASGNTIDVFKKNGNTSWLSLNTDLYAGTVKMTMASNDYLISDEDPGRVGGSWKSMLAETGSGYTIEVKLQVVSHTSGKSNGACLLSASDGVKDRNAWMNFYTDKITWGSAELKKMTTTDGFHTYRIVRIADADQFYVYVDGKLVRDNLTNGYGNLTVNRLLLGAAGANWAGTVNVAYIRFTKGMYAPAPIKQLASADFDYKYEMHKLPTEENLPNSGSAKDFKLNGSNWLTLGNKGDAGTVSMNINGGQNIISEGASGVQGDVWKSLGLTAEDAAYTIETRLKITDCTGSKGALLLNASYGVANQNSWLQFFSDQIKWNDKKIADVKPNDWHTYRLVAEDNQYQVYVDGVLVSGDTPLGNGFSTTQNRLLFGGPGSNYAGAAQVAWLRLTKGAYAPLDNAAEEAIEKANRLFSSEFDVKYEMTETLPATDWKTGGSGAAIAYANGILSVTTGNNSAYWDTQAAAWKDKVDKDTPYTVEFSIKVNSADANDRAINLMTGSNGGAVSDFFVGANSVQWCPDMSKNNQTFVTLDTSDNTDKFHTFRIAYDGKTRHGFTLWRDGVKIGENLVDCTNYYNYSNGALGIVRFGKAGDYNAGSFNVNYVRWKIGGVYPPDNRPGMLIRVR